MFDIPMSSPHRMRMFGFPVLAISISFDWLGEFTKTSRLADPPPGQLHETQQHGSEGEHADQDKGERDRAQRCLHPFVCHSGELCKASAPEVTDGPVVLPNG